MADYELTHPRGDFIDGAFQLPNDSSGEIKLEDPGNTSAELSAFPFARDAVDAAVDAARRAWPLWREVAFEERSALLRRFADEIANASELLTQAIALEAGKPLWEARTEVNATVAKFEITLGAGMDLVREQRFEMAPGQAARWRNPSRGVMAVLGPFNFPVHLVNGHVIPALATGNTVVIKPSEKTPLVGQLYAELAARAGLPKGVLNLIQGDGGSGAALAAHSDVAGVLFTGSYAVGRRILEATLNQPHKLVALEMGGKNGVFVAADANLDAAARAIAFGCAVTAGQRCTATSRVFAVRSVAEPLTEKLAGLFRRLKVGHHSQEDVFSGPLISSASQERHRLVHQLADQDRAERVVEGGAISGPYPGHYVRPSLHWLDTLDRDSRYQGEEHFVPDCFVHPVAGVDEGAAALDATDFGLAASVFSAERETYEHVASRICMGIVNWNTGTVGASSKLPFGGQKKSGNERPAGISSTVYCTAPMASVEVEVPDATPRWPGFPE